MGTKSQFCKMKRVMKMDGGDVSTRLSLYFYTTEPYI